MILIGDIIDDIDLRTRSINGTRYIYTTDTYYNLANLAEGGKQALEKGKHGLKITIWSNKQPSSLKEETVKNAVLNSQEGDE